MTLTNKEGIARYNSVLAAAISYEDPQWNLDAACKFTPVTIPSWGSYRPQHSEAMWVATGQQGGIGWIVLLKGHKMPVYFILYKLFLGTKIRGD